ncbi:hypothetical protein [Bacillus coahuilensis]|nr:hypothetical protein [Bacillus coahuilensis]
MYRQLPFFPPPTSPPSSFPGFPQGGGQPNQPGFPGQSPSQGGNQMPPGPPPSQIPVETQSASVMAVDPGSIRGCLFRYTYIWQNNRQSYWFYPTFVGRRSVSGYRWTGWGWVYFGVDLRRIRSFTCV